MKVYEKRYLHTSKEDNWDMEEKYGFRDLVYMNYEVEVLVEIDTETGDYKIIGCNGQKLSDEEYT